MMCAAQVTNRAQVCYTFVPCSGVVQLVARQPLELVILVRVQAPEPPVSWRRGTKTGVPPSNRGVSTRNQRVATPPKRGEAWAAAQS
jgi:hypothetical protein